MSGNGKSTALAVVDEREITAMITRAAPMWPKDLSPDERRAVAMLAIENDLDPLAGELIIYRGKPYVTVDGRLRKARESGKWLGIVDDRPARDDEYAACHVNPKTDMLWFISIKHADWIKPNGAYGRVKADDQNPVGKQYPAEVARKRALYRCLREAFSVKFRGIGEDETVSTMEAATDNEPVVNTMASNGQIAAIHALAKELDLSTEQYHTEIERMGGVASSKDLTQFQAQDIIDAWAERAEAEMQPGITDFDYNSVAEAVGGEPLPVKAEKLEPGTIINAYEICAACKGEITDYHTEVNGKRALYGRQLIADTAKKRLGYVACYQHLQEGKAEYDRLAGEWENLHHEATAELGIVVEQIDLFPHTGDLNKARRAVVNLENRIERLREATQRQEAAPEAQEALALG